MIQQEPLSNYDHIFSKMILIPVIVFDLIFISGNQI